MEVYNKVFYHFHKPNIESDKWISGGEIIVDENFTSNLISSCLELYNKYSDLIDNISNGKIDIKKLAKLGLSIDDIIFFRYVYKREQFFEEYRARFKSNLPSRHHSLWLCGEEQLEHWALSLDNDCELYKVLATGTIFTTSDKYIPAIKATDDEIIVSAANYWNPREERNKSEDEILFQGRLRILERLDADYYRYSIVRNMINNSFNSVNAPHIIAPKNDMVIDSDSTLSLSLKHN